MNEHNNEWSRKDAEAHIADVLDAAKTGATQVIVDFDGNFEVRFLAPLVQPQAADGPVALELSEDPATAEPERADD